ncbi:NUDIX hydrolase [Neolewinella sp.]|uniref:NUDIX hydrolase n=1 Tax=Neolewinella sp. TaxID=2993543 RepID=UPI003B524DAB
MFTYEYPRPSVTVDVVVFGYDGGRDLKLLLIQRGGEPFKGQWALPGGFVDMDEDLEASALRELEEETGVKDLFVEQLYTFGAPGRDPRGRVISVAYFALVNLTDHPAVAASDAEQAEWYPLHELPELAFDHARIIDMATNRLRAKVRYQPIGFELLPEEFTLAELQALYETVLGVPEFNKRNFRTRIMKTGILEEVGRQENVPHRPAVLYRFNEEMYQQLMDQRDSAVLRRALDFEI